MSRLVALLGKQGARVVILVLVLGLSGVLLGLAAGYPLSKVRFEESDAVRVDHSRLAGEIDPATAVVGPDDLPIDWQPGDQALAGFGLLGAGFCGEEVPLPTPLSDVQSVVFADPSDGSILISQAVRVDRWQNARSYVDDVSSAVGECDEFFRAGLDGSRIEVDIEEGTGEAPITDYVSRSFVDQKGDSVQTWSIMSVGDVIIALLHAGPTAPQQGFLSGLEDALLMRIDPAEFAPGGVVPSTAPTTSADPTATTVLEGGAADESEVPAAPAPVEGGEPGD